MARNYAIYNPENELVGVYTNKAHAVDFIGEVGRWEMRTYKYLTAQQIKSLGYIQAVSMELTMRAENGEVLEMISETKSNPKMKYGE